MNNGKKKVNKPKQQVHVKIIKQNPTVYLPYEEVLIQNLEEYGKREGKDFLSIHFNTF